MRLCLSLHGPFRASLDGAQLRIASRRSRAMLALLACEPGHAVSRDRLAAMLWPDRGAEQARASLRQELSSLRRALGPASALLEADNSQVCLSAVEIAAPVDHAPFLDGLDLSSEPFEDWRRDEAARRDAGKVAPAPDIFANPSVLVLAFAPAGAAPEDVALATGLVCDLRTSLAQWRWYPVIGPEAIGWQSDHDGDLRAIAGTVGAAYAISGSVQRAGDRIRVSVGLTEMKGGTLVWSDRFDGAMSQIFDMQEAVGRAVVARVTPEIGRAETARIVRQHPTDMAAWQLVAQTDEIERTGGEGYGSPQANASMVPLLEAAVRRAPGFARAWARQGRYHFRAGLLGWVPDAGASYDRALACCDRALAVDPAEWEAHAYLGLIRIFGRHDFGAGRFHAMEAVRLNPSAPIARHALGCALEWLGHPEEALQHLRLVFDLNPNFPNRAAVYGDITTCEMFIGQRDAAVASARHLRAIAPDYVRGLQRAAATLGWAGMRDEAQDALQRVRVLQPDFDETHVRRSYPYARPEDLETFVQGLRMAGLHR